MKKILALVCLLFTFNSFAETGVLFLAHGTAMDHGGGHGSMSCTPHHWPKWEKYVLDTLTGMKAEMPAKFEVAFGMWESHCFDEAISRLETRFAAEEKTMDHLVVFPLFISSHSLVIEMQKFIFKKRPDMVIPIPTVHQTYYNGKITYMSALDYEPHISMILANRFHHLVHLAKDKGHKMNNMELVLVMHGPVGDAHNVKWMEMGEKYAKDVMYLFPVATSHVISLRDDAPTEVRDRVTREFQAIVSGARSQGRIALVLPLLVSEGGIDKGILERLEGLEYIWSGEAILPDAKLKDVVLTKLNKIISK